MNNALNTKLLNDYNITQVGWAHRRFLDPAGGLIRTGTGFMVTSYKDDISHLYFLRS
jgi:hypothetical protein